MAETRRKTAGYGKQVLRWSRSLPAAVSLIVACLLAACGGQPGEPVEQTVMAGLLTLQPEMAMTLTAWPTPPPILTLPPTSTPAPQALWTSDVEPNAADTAEPTSLAVQTPTVAPAPGTVQTPVGQVDTAPVGSNARASQLLIPELGLNVPIVEVSWQVVLEDGIWSSRWQTADDAAGHHRNSANPGEAGNVVVSGHHNTGAEVFRDLSEIGMPGNPLGEGTQIILQSEDGSQHIYSIVSWERFQVENIPDTDRLQYARYMEPSTDPRLTLITCWPYETKSHRVVIVAELLPPE